MVSVHIEFQRVQSWLFAVPRLRAMVGANALLGQTIRITLPNLAREQGRGWALSKTNRNYPRSDVNDPLRDHDDPARDANDGILSRDGGHFEALFEDGAEVFVKAAEETVRTRLPGLRLSVSINGKKLFRNRSHISPELPVLAPCEETGRGLASATVNRGNAGRADYEQRSVSLDAQARDRAGKAANNQSNDLASMLRAKTLLRDLETPQDLGDLVGNGYLALIHADGNNVGGGQPGDRASAAAFFHKNRVLLRRALKDAIDGACEGLSGFAPLVPLMLGGDDLLLVCRAAMALPLVVRLCETLHAIQEQESEGDFKLTLGIGVVLAKDSVPIHRLHEVAEQLASSAKRRFRGLKQGDRKSSVVDWAVYSSAWVGDPEEMRRRDWVRGERDSLRILSQRPIDVLGVGLDSLQGLLRASKKLKKAPRSQLRYLVDQLPRGRALSELAFGELSSEAREKLYEVGLKEPWLPADGCQVTPLLDLVEITEIGRLGHAVGPVSPNTEVANV